MNRKNLLTTVACVALVGALAIPAAAAHGGRHHARRAAVNYPTCAVSECTLTYRHDHDGVTYCGHTAGDGHDWCAEGYGRGRCH